MSTILKAQGTNVHDNVFIFYDFKQVSDMIMIVACVEKNNRWEKLFIYNDDGEWQVETLRQYFNEHKFNWVSSKLNVIFQNRELTNHFDVVDIDKEMQNEAAFMVALNAV